MFAFLINLISWPMNTLPCKADAGITNEPKQKGLKIPLCRPGSVQCSCTLVSSEFFTVLALGSLHIQPCVWSGGVVCSRWEELVSSQWQTVFVCRTEKEMALNGPEAVICCWQTDTVLSGEALSCHCGLTAGFHPSALQSLFTMQVALKCNSCS